MADDIGAAMPINWGPSWPETWQRAGMYAPAPTCFARHIGRLREPSRSGFAFINPPWRPGSVEGEEAS